MTSERIDIAAWFDDTLAQVPHNLAAKRDAMREAREAVVDLIEADQEEIDARLAFFAADADSVEAASTRLDDAEKRRAAALARIGGAA